jgi:hypothetical protein
MEQAAGFNHAQIKVEVLCNVKKDEERMLPSRLEKGKKHWKNEKVSPKING